MPDALRHVMTSSMASWRDVKRQALILHNWFYFIGLHALEKPEIDTKIDVVERVVPEIDISYFWRQAWRHDVT